MWVKAKYIDSGIELSWQVRTNFIKGNLISYDSNGMVETSCPIERAHYYDSMKSAGIVNIDDNFAKFCGIEHFNDVIFSIMRHMVNMVTAGYGDNPEEVVGWYSNISELKFLVGTRFRFDYEYEPFVDMIGLIGFVDIDDDGEYVVSIEVRNDIFRVPLDSDKILVSFIISTTPV